VLILVRHGQSTANAAGLLVGRTDAALTERGRDQARSLAEHLEDVVAVVSSPLQRARETAALALPGLEVELEEAFIEQDYGRYDGLAMAEVPEAEWRQFREVHGAALGGGESLDDVDARVHARLSEWAEGSDSLLADPRRHLVVVSHVSPIKSAVAWALGVPGSVAWRLRLDNATLTTIGVRGGGAFLAGYNEAPAGRRVHSTRR
jgi:probable phosphoglycerate mutase